MFRPLRAPLWFHLCVAVTLALLLRQLGPVSGYASPDAGSHGDVQLAFWGFILAIGEAIWKGLEVAGKITLQALAWSVHAIWFALAAAQRGLTAIGLGLARAGRAAWNFLEATYDHVLKPAWSKFWHYFDRFRRWLTDVMSPVISFLNKVRKYLLDIYTRFVRPVLDIIDITRRALRVLGSLGVGWARTLDAKLADLEERIDRPFRLVLQELNKVINVVNRIMTADGLFQRLTLLRSIARDYRQTWQVLWEPMATPLTPAQRDAYSQALKLKSRAEHNSELTRYVAAREGPIAPRVNEWIADVKIQVSRAR